MFESKFLGLNIGYKKNTFPTEVRKIVLWDSGRNIITHKITEGSYTFVEMDTSPKRISFDFSMGWFQFPFDDETKQRTQCGTVTPSIGREEFREAFGLFGFGELMGLHPKSLPNQKKWGYTFYPHAPIELQDEDVLPLDLVCDPPSPTSEEYLENCEKIIKLAVDALVKFGLPYLREYEEWLLENSKAGSQ